MRRHSRFATRLGELVAVAADREVVGLYFPGHWTAPPAEMFGDPAPADDALLTRLASEVRAWLEGEVSEVATPHRAYGTEFEERVWEQLTRIGYGETTTYGAIAAEVGMPGGAQAIGHIVGANPLSILIPCHRVVGADGSLTGYAGGLERKRYLLDLEAYLTGQTLLDPRL